MINWIKATPENKGGNKMNTFFRKLKYGDYMRIILANKVSAGVYFIGYDNDLLHVKSCSKIFGGEMQIPLKDILKCYIYRNPIVLLKTGEAK
jgi:hypothetical protein